MGLAEEAMLARDEIEEDREHAKVLDLAREKELRRKEDELGLMDQVWDVQCLLETHVKLGLAMGASHEKVARYLANVRRFLMSPEAAR